MERSPAAAGERKEIKRPKAKKPIKVVCISNPMKFKTSASEFRSLVQRLTGQDSDTADIVSRYDHPPQEADNAPLDATSAAAAELSRTASAAAAAAEPARGFCPLELLDGAFDTRMQESFPW